MALRNDGTVLAWGWSEYGQTNVPSDLTNAVAVVAGYYHCVALRDDGTVVAWGAGTNNRSGTADLGQSMVPAGLSNVVGVAAGAYHSLALKADGTVTAWGWNASRQCSVPSNLTKVVAVAGSLHHSLALKVDGTVVGWGTWGNVPANLSNVVSVTCGAGGVSMAIKTDGSVIGWNCSMDNDVCNVPPNLPPAAAVATSGSHALALLNAGGPPPTVLMHPRSQTAPVGSKVWLSVRATGLPPLSYQWYCNGTNAISGGTNFVLELANLRQRKRAFILWLSRLEEA